MKVVTRILNIILGIFFIIGVYSTVMYFVKVRPLQDDYTKQLEKNYAMEVQQDANNRAVNELEYSLYAKDKIILERNDRISEMANEIDEANKREKEAFKKLQNLSLEELIDFISNYYGISPSDIEVIAHNNEIRITFKEPLVRQVVNTITKLEYVTTELNLYKDQSKEYECLMESYIDKIELINRRDSLNVDNLRLEKEQNTGLENIIDNRNRRIKSLTTQRTILGGVVVVVLVIALI